MPMNEQPPWGKKKQPSGPEDLLAALIQKVRDTFAGRDKEPPQGPPGEPPAEESFERTAAFDWLRTHAGAHGFTMSYPRDNPHGIVYEPWHWRHDAE